MTGYEWGQIAVLGTFGTLTFIGGVIAGHSGAILLGLTALGVAAAFFWVRSRLRRRD